MKTLLEFIDKNKVISKVTYPVYLRYPDSKSYASILIFVVLGKGENALNELDNFKLSEKISNDILNRIKKKMKEFPDYVFAISPSDDSFNPFYWDLFDLENDTNFNHNTEGLEYIGELDDPKNFNINYLQSL